MSKTSINPIKTDVIDRTDELAAIYALSKKINANLSIEELVLSVLDEILDTVSPDMALFFIREGEKFILLGGKGDAVHGDPDVIPIHRVGECLCSLSVSQKKPQYSQDIFSDPGSTWSECKDSGFTAFAALPIIDQQEVMGVLGLASLAKRDFELRRDFLEALVSEVSVGLKNAILFEELKKKNDALLHTQMALAESEIKYRSLFERGSDILFYHDLEGNILDTNLFFKKEYGWNKKDLENVNFRDLIPERYRPGLKAYLSRIVEKGKDHGHLRIRLKNKREVILEYNNVLMTGPDGKTGVSGAARDVTNRFRSEKALRKSQEKFKTLSEKAPLGIALIKATGQYEYINPRFIEIFGYTLTDIPTGAEWFLKAYPDPEYRETAIRSWKHDLGTIQPGEVRPRTYTVTCKNSAAKEIHFIPVTLEDGSQLVFFEDITKKNKLEKQLRQSQKIEAIGELAGGIAHDFNNILSGIMGYTELSIDQAHEGSLIHANLMKVKTAGNRAKDLVKQILMFSRHGSQDRVPVKIKLIVKEAMKLMRASLPATISIHTILESKAVVNADPTQIHQVLINLCTNAGQAMADNGGVLTVEIKDMVLDGIFVAHHPGLTAGPHVKIRVADTGYGIDPMIQDRIFDPFFTTKKKGKGTGLGLSVVHGIIRDHGGSIRVYSEPGYGTTFNVLLPASDMPERAEPTAPGASPRGSESILFVDDEPHQVDMMRQLLEKLGYTVVALTDSTEALKQVQKTPDQFDMVITDMTMPIMTGDMLAKEVRSIKPDMPIIICTGYSEKITEKKAHSMGINAFLMKPVVMNDLAVAVRTTLDQSLSSKSRLS